MYLLSWGIFIYFLIMSNSSVAQNKFNILSVKTDILDYPYIVAIILTETTNTYTDCLCSGTIINPKWILTAGQCIFHRKNQIYRPYSLSIIAGSTKCYKIDRIVQFRRVKKYILHPKYRETHHGPIEHFYHDLSLLYLEQSLIFGGRVQPVKLSTPKLFQDIRFQLKTCLAIGWGIQENDTVISPNLYKINLALRYPQPCMKAVQYVNLFVNPFEIICTEDALDNDICRGNTGGPFMCSYPAIQMGIISTGIGCSKIKLNLWVRVDKYYDWIHRMMSIHGSENNSIHICNNITVSLILFLLIYF